MRGLVVVLVVLGGLALSACSSKTNAPSSTTASNARNAVVTSLGSTTTTPPFVPTGAARMPAPCPPDSDTPSVATGIYCGPTPPAGNGLGPNGECDGNETVPPCGPGAVVGTYYAYTQPRDCAGNPIHFDGRLWYSLLKPHTNWPDIDVWMALQPDGTLEAISSEEMIGFAPDTGQAPVSACNST